MARRAWSTVARYLLVGVLLLQASLFPASGLAARPVSAASAASLTEPEAPPASPDPTLNSTFDSPLPPPVDTLQIAPLTLALQVTPNWVEPGDVLTVTVTAAASAASDLTALVIQDTLPAGLLYVAGSARGFESTASENALTWQVPKLTAGAVITGSFQARVQGLALGATVTHTVTATTAQPPAAASSAAVVEIVSPGNNDVEVALRDNAGLRYLLGDHLGSTNVTANVAGTWSGELLYGPWGATRYTSGVTPTSYRFTGQREEATVGLYYYGARWYDPVNGRFIQPDTIVPDPANPQSLNRYAYGLNNPLRYTDPTGHVWRDMSDGAGPNGTGSWAGALAFEARTNPQYSSIRALLVAGGAALFGGTLLAGTAGVAEAGTTIATTACADGDCTNEVSSIEQAVQSAGQAAQSVWRLDPLKRGQEIERMLGRSPQLAQNFPVIDRFENGVATSIKSIDLSAKSYQSIGKLTSTVRGYVSELANWQGVRSWANFGVSPSDITSRELLLAIPTGATEAQIVALRALQQWASTVGVNVNITVVP